MFYKYSLSETEYRQVCLAPKRKSGSNANISDGQPLLNVNGRAISKEKYKDLKDLLPYIPPVHHSFFKSLRTDPQIQTDDFNGNSIDFEFDE